MFHPDHDRDTICALATAQGVSALAIIRVSGENADFVMRAIAPDLTKDLCDHRAYYTFLRNPFDGEVIDEVMATYFAKGRSYTREPSFEISCHGNPHIVGQILHALVRSGARLAERGEFTYRAVMNGRIDLVQAESVLDLIESQSPRAAKMALRSLRGELSNQLLAVEDDLVWALAQLEANIDFSSEDIIFTPYDNILNRLADVETELKRLVQSFHFGRIIKEGLNVVIVGPPNVGKSSLFNKLAGEERSIVSERPGTTRDWVDFEKQVYGQLIRFVDCAGVRITDDEVEDLGINRALKAIESADVAIRVIDVKTTEADEMAMVDLAIQNAKVSTVITVGNKCDLLAPGEEPKVSVDLLVSAAKDMGLDKLLEKILEKTDLSILDDGALIHNTRQFEALSSAVKFLEASKMAVERNRSPEFVAADLQSCLQEIMKLRGAQLNNEVTDRVFHDFCIGK